MNVTLASLNETSTTTNVGSAKANTSLPTSATSQLARSGVTIAVVTVDATDKVTVCAGIVTTTGGSKTATFTVMVNKPVPTIIFVWRLHQMPNVVESSYAVE